MMVVNLSIGKKSYEGLDEHIKETFMKEFDNVKVLQKELTGLVDEDTKAFNKFMEAMKLPKDTEEQKKVRGEKMQEASLYALHVPLKTAESCYNLLKNQACIAKYGNKNAVSDVGVGALLALSGLEGAMSGEVLRDCAASGNKSRCVTYRLTRERALAPPAQDPAEPSFSQVGTLR
jgi:formiminotetrahydrofolate cyclodeaminase